MQTLYANSYRHQQFFASNVFISSNLFIHVFNNSILEIEIYDHLFLFALHYQHDMGTLFHHNTERYRAPHRIRFLME